MGSSGAGKTSLLNVLAGETTSGVYGGSVFVNGKKITSAKKMKELSGLYI